MAKNKPEPGPKEFQIQIDRTHYTVQKESMTGEELRNVPDEMLGVEVDLWEVVPGETDNKVENDEAVDIKNGMRFFTAPAQITPGFLTIDSCRW